MASISDDKVLTARIADAAALCQKNGYPHFIGFLDERERALAEGQLRRIPAVTSIFWGGFAEAERTLLGVFPDYFEPDTVLFPLVGLTFRYREEAALSHRDFLGTMLGKGVRREKIGDILCMSGRTVAFVGEDVASFLSQQVEKVGGEGVTVTLGFDGDLLPKRQYRDIHMTVASPRLDNVVKALTGLSREKAAETVETGLVSLNHLLCQAVSKTVCEGDSLSIRGFGRFRVISLSTRTKKERFMLFAQKYL